MVAVAVDPLRSEIVDVKQNIKEIDAGMKELAVLRGRFDKLENAQCGMRGAGQDTAETTLIVGGLQKSEFEVASQWLL